jgi:excinuclease UvrABC ATPase subunit
VVFVEVVVRQIVCDECRGNGWVVDFVSLNTITCAECGGYGYNKYKVEPVRRKDEVEIIAWKVTTPDRAFIKIEFSFDNALVWADIHANANGALEPA